MRIPRVPGVALAAFVVLAGCGGGDLGPGDVLPATASEEDPGVVHVHGLGVNPADGLVYVATHFGLWRLGEEGEPQRVGDYFYDFMGFTVVGDDHFVASGHPTLADPVPPLLGLIESTDGGGTWRSVSLLGEADFHALRAAHGQIYGWNSSGGEFMASADGEEWEERSAQWAMLDFVVDPGDAETVLAAVVNADQEATLVVSEDGGRSWTSVDGPPLVRLAWNSPGELWGVSVTGGVWRSEDGGASWDEAGSVAGSPESLVHAGDRLVVAIGGAILESTDDGRTWEERYRTH